MSNVTTDRRDPRSNLNESFARTDAHYQVGYHQVFHGGMLAADDLYEARALLAAELYFRPEERSLRVFEYGCGVGQTIAQLPNAAGWDISEEGRAASRAHGVRVYDDFAQIPSTAWDIVICRHVLEHIEAPLDALKQIRSLLTPRGKVVLVIPKEPHFAEPLRPDYTQHLYAWNQRAIVNLLFRAGMRPTFVTYLYPFGAHRLMPLRRALGHKAYMAIVRAGSVLRRNPEMVVHAVPA